MKAIRIHEYGGTDVLRCEDVPAPEPGPRDVVVDVRATSVNPVDWKIRSGTQRAVVRLALPWTLGMDVSGVVSAVGAEVTRFDVGDEVFSSPTHRRPGTYAERIAIDQDEVALKPTTVSFEEAASLPLVALTAWDCLVTAARVQPGQRVLVQAGAGGVGTVAIQLAKHLGAEVATTCSTRNVDFVRELGADRVIDYTCEDFDDMIRQYDVVLECLGGDVYRRSFGVLRHGGCMASINSGLGPAVKRWGPYLGVAAVAQDMITDTLSARLMRGIRLHMVVRKPSGTNLASIAGLVETGAIRPVVAETFPLERMADAHRASESGRTRGKIVVTP